MTSATPARTHTHVHRERQGKDFLPRIIPSTSPLVPPPQLLALPSPSLVFHPATHLVLPSQFSTNYTQITGVTSN